MKTYQIDSGVALVAMETRLGYDYQDVALIFRKCLYKQKIQIRFYISYTCDLYKWNNNDNWLNDFFTKWIICDMKINDLPEKCPLNQLFIAFYHFYYKYDTIYPALSVRQAILSDWYPVGTSLFMFLPNAHVFDWSLKYYLQYKL